MKIVERGKLITALLRDRGRSRRLIIDWLQRKQQARSEYDQTIQETEAAYMKILESSQTLLHVLKRESVNLVKKQSSSH